MAVYLNDDDIEFLKQWRHYRGSQSLHSEYSSQNPHQCDHCRRSAVIFEPVSGKELRFHSLPYNTGTAKFTLSDVVRGARNGCYLHRWLLDVLSQKRNDLKASERTGRFYNVRMTVTLTSYYESTLIPNAYIGQNMKEREKWDAKKIMNRPNEGAEVQHRFQIAKSPYLAEVEIELLRWSDVILTSVQELSFWTCLGQSFKSSTRGLPCISAPAPVEWNKGSAKSMAFAKEWLHRCQHFHTSCSPLHNSFESDTIILPSRLLVIGSTLFDGAVRIVESANLTDESKYAVLSYCWGGPQRVYLTRSNQDSLSWGIPVNQLAKSVQDGITVCAELQIAYLWVDALCIIQDDPVDQERELGKMAMYYENSLVTICAASAPKSDVGFLLSNEDAHYRYDVGPFVMQFRELERTSAYEECTKAQVTADYYRKSDSDLQFLAGGETEMQLFRFRNNSYQNQPISKRAWTFQEMLLSTRMLIYASDQLYWCCRESYTGCGGSNSSERIVPVRRDCQGPQSKVCVCGISLIREIHDLPSDIYTLGQRSGLTTDAQWDMVVENFSARDLSVEGDKLRAFAAVASYFGMLFKARWPDVRYAAGLWYSGECPRSFCRQLLWKSEDPSQARRPVDLRAPSWSWASIDGRVSVFDRRMENMFYDPPSLTVQSVRAEPTSTLAPFGEVKSGLLRVCGKLRILELPLARKIALTLRQYFDTRDDYIFQQKQKHLYLLEITPYRSQKDSPKGLILVPYSNLAGNGILVFWRVGVFSCLKEFDFAEYGFELATKRIIDII